MSVIVRVSRVIAILVALMLSVPVVAQGGRAAREREVRDALGDMVQQLENRRFVDFIRLHFPIQTYLQWRESRNSFRPDELARLGELKEHLAGFQDAELTVDIRGQYARFTRTIKAEEQERLLPRYPQTPDSSPPGYRGDVKDAIKAGLGDLESGNAEEFLEKMLPPAAIAMLKADARWESAVQAMTDETEEKTRMKEDLTLLLKETPEIDGDTASFQLPHLKQPENPRRQARSEEKADEEYPTQRSIRFSRIDGTWRFFDSATETTLAVNEAATGVPRDKVVELKLEK
ncbi:MAG: hypothetical protein KDA96_15050, partial [Planctomycetaceae bacterium]|nr:hypothetical protein [Planctomycetaceae bacterium]